ncbi:hypothetical protein [Candidatus Nitronereus thalassa]|uniref:Uncharacterized protein n=1 Tax=Candidatus Nitronereus thalassa TaxID=3020898 RepID=A0ABU3K785_9BACT|nr:hypothetical protein [Candidatus Nitronereus thalassa]MDT7042282.1 hypothetical protein [Candidatus Nitronereus thalassa]
MEKQVVETSTSSLSLKAIDIRRTYTAENDTPSGLHKVLLIIKNDSKLAKTIHGIKATVPGEKFGISSINGAYLKPEGFFTFQEVTLHPMEHAAFELCSLHERKTVGTRLSFGCQTNEGGKASWREIEQPEKQTFPLSITAKDYPGQEWTIELKISETEISCETVFVGERRKDQNPPLRNSSELYFPNNFIKSHG